MRNLFKVLAVVALTAFNTGNAQQVIKKDTLQGTVLTMAMDSKVDDLLSNMEDNCSRTVTKRSNTEVDKPATTGKVLVANRAKTNAEVCRQNPRLLGYKIQVAVVKSNDEANDIRGKVRRLFPSLKVQLDASLRPNYKVLAGSYFSKESAKSDLAQVRKEFSGATAVQYQVFCVEAK